MIDVFAPHGLQEIQFTDCSCSQENALQGVLNLIKPALKC
jgi:hypothetical protein